MTIRSTLSRLCFPVALLLACGVAADGAEVSVLLTGSDGKPLENAVVYVTASGAAPTGAPKPAEIDQLNRMFVPQVTVIQVGAAVSFPNSDNIRHQVYSFSPAKTFNTKLYSGRQADPVVFDKAGVVVLGCNIHDRMVAWVVVVDTPWFARTGSEGRAIIRDLPAGAHQLTVWHSGLKGEPYVRPITLAADAKLDEVLQLDAMSPQVVDHSAHGAGQ